MPKPCATGNIQTFIVQQAAAAIHHPSQQELKVAGAGGKRALLARTTPATGEQVTILCHLAKQHQTDINRFQRGTRNDAVIS